MKLQHKNKNVKKKKPRAVAEGWGGEIVKPEACSGSPKLVFARQKFASKRCYVFVDSEHVFQAAIFAIELFAERVTVFVEQAP
ncbi:MAG: hypothetical protein RL150_117 [Candidatus Parcubacteria bacterium]